MVRSLRFLTGTTILIAMVSFTAFGQGQTGFAADDPKVEKKEDKKLQLPKLPEGSNPKWDFKAVEEKFTIIKGNVNEDGYIYFLLELKEDIAQVSNYRAILIDNEGVKFAKILTGITPISGSKGDRVRMTLNSYAPEKSKDTWLKTVKVQFVND